MSRKFKLLIFISFIILSGLIVRYFVIKHFTNHFVSFGYTEDCNCHYFIINNFENGSTLKERNGKYLYKLQPANITIDVIEPDLSDLSYFFYNFNTDKTVHMDSFEKNEIFYVKDTILGELKIGLISFYIGDTINQKSKHFAIRDSLIAKYGQD